ncbi:RagB/SusD family nutrient uptake outer membrane protein [Polaribacter vadi]|uniref:RagB/SusD family nutrient uptake outer membrane protein n=1 Tax=Polaribacter TaxID=52959 RepID=UPI001C0A421E|nr:MULTISPECIES: RagB/SusD family nutrient uptake outer membrane protein [Polaribacter]MBU3011289.1 RagB/SusD family nutrient uptake outer membrane protein [Polaribacter vadi]MDO6741102.1 RagB/SusD family nutrient uptake outer membrane protein [Polaribacter sp. 1_MG-2023]
MKKNKYIIILLTAVFFISCEDYLDKVEGADGLDQEAVFTDVRLATNFLDGAYGYLTTEVSNQIGNFTDRLPAMTMGGEGYPGRINQQHPENYGLYAQGDYSSLMNKGLDAQATPVFARRYKTSWRGIRITSTFLENADFIQNSNQEEIDGLKGQAYFLRAFYYHILTKRHGGLLYLKNTIEVNETITAERESYESNYADMLEDLNFAIELLPKEWEGANLGRVTKGTAMALKSRLTLFAASPLVNTSSSSESWSNAAIAASDLIEFANSNGLYTLADASTAANLEVDHDGADLFVSEPEKLQPYRSLFVGPGASKAIPSEVIHMEANLNTVLTGSRTIPIPRLALTTGFDILKGNGQPAGIGALANFVDKFETKNGLPIDEDPSYNPQEPFINRDPRFYNAILFDGVPWTHVQSGPINATGIIDLAVVNEQGNRGLDLSSSSLALWKVKNLTGYRIRKWVPNGYWYRSTASLDFYVNNIVFRMAEVYLNYAEAANEAYGPNGRAPGASLTALEAVNKIRNRVGMPNIDSRYSGSKELLRERIRNERAIELCFEGHRYDDLRRWKVAHLEENLKVEYLEMRWQGVSATYPSGFSYENVEQDNLKKTFNEKNYWWPIPNSELEAVPSFGQTPGW